MAKPWTVKEQKICSIAYSTEGVEAAMKATGRSKQSVYWRMQKLGVASLRRPEDSLNKNERKWFRDDIAKAFEMSVSGLSAGIIAEYFDSTAGAIRGAISLAKNKGFDAYPLRNKS